MTPDLPVPSTGICKQPASDSLLSAFLWSSLNTFICGFVLIVRGRPDTGQLRPRDMYLLTTGSWVVVCSFAALPMVFISDISYTDAFFETMSGITTTGSTVLTGLDTASPGLLIWRSMLHWLGGIGFIGMAVAILPLLRVGGMRLFQTESSDWSEKVTPRSHVAAKYILLLYLGLTGIGALALWLTGMTPFEAVNHAMSLISTGGFSTSDASLGHWAQPAIHWVAVAIMILGSLPFTLYVATLRGDRRALVQDHQVRGFLGFYLTFVGGCSGSTAGGLKIFRFQVAAALLVSSLKQLIHPRAVIQKRCF